MSSQTIRQQFRQRRRQVTGDTRNAAEAAICKLIAQTCRNADLIAAYNAFDGEPDLSSWMVQTTSSLCLPHILEEPGAMSFFAWQPNDTTQANHYGIEEPLSAAQPIAPDALDIVLVPLVAFDTHGTRLGMGAGYYDRYLLQAGNAQHIGVAFDCQCSTTTLTRQKWDHPLHKVVTESGIMTF